MTEEILNKALLLKSKIDNLQRLADFAVDSYIKDKVDNKKIRDYILTLIEQKMMEFKIL